MYTSLDKALISAVVGLLGIVGVVWKPINISPDTIATIVSIATPILVYLWPNAPKDT